MGTTFVIRSGEPKKIVSKTLVVVPARADAILAAGRVT